MRKDRPTETSSTMCVVLALFTGASGCSSSPGTAPDAGSFDLPDTGGALGDAAGDATAGEDGRGDGGADGGSADAGVACAAGGTPTMHASNIMADETWGPGVHVVPTSISVSWNAHLTIA